MTGAPRGASGFIAGTIVTRRQRPLARALADAFYSHHSSADFVVLVTDEREDKNPTIEATECRWLGLGDLGLTQAEAHHLAAAHDAENFVAVLKPLFLRYLLSTYADCVLYLAPQTAIYGGLTALVDLADRHGLVLVPYATEPPVDAETTDGPLLRSGVYNTEILAVGSAARPFLDWWWNVARHDLAEDRNETALVAQHAIDLAPAMLTPYISRAPEYGVGHWNLHTRHLIVEESQYLVERVPLRTFHFQGFDLQKPWLLNAEHGHHPRVLLSERPVVAQLCAEYVGSLARAGLHADADAPYGWSTMASGLTITPEIRHLYRSAVRASERGESPRPPDPFDRAEPDAFTAWLRSPSEDGPRQCSRYLYRIYQRRPDLRIHFPDIHFADSARFLEWIREHGVNQEGIPPELVPRPDEEVTDRPTSLVEGVNIAGYFRAELGIGEAGRLLTKVVDAAGMPYATSTYDVSASRQSHPFVDRTVDTPFDINILCVNAVSTPRFRGDMGPRFFADRYTVGYWFWEIEHFPRSMHRAFDVVDEVWTASDFVAEAIRAAGRKPVFTIPLPLLAPEYSPDITRERLGLPERFVFLSVFDFLSVVERKNPLGLIAAFARAFAPNEGPVLLLKSINGHLRMDALEQVRAAASGRPDIQIVDGYYTAEEMSALLSLCDCYVSLHRSEGLGLTMAEAMAAGRPVIATGYSGNMHFMTPENSYLVDYVPSSVPRGCDPYPTGTMWVSPDINHAARLMREVYDLPDAAAARGARARADLQHHHNVRTSANAITRRLHEIRQTRATRATHSQTLDEHRAADATEALLAQLTQLARPRVTAEGRLLAQARSMGQRVLFRLLRPYWHQQTQFNQAALAALRELNLRLVDQQQRADDARLRTHELQRTLLARSAAFGDHVLEAMKKLEEQ